MKRDNTKKMRTNLHKHDCFFPVLFEPACGWHNLNHLLNRIEYKTNHLFSWTCAPHNDFAFHCDTLHVACDISIRLGSGTAATLRNNAPLFIHNKFTTVCFSRFCRHCALCQCSTFIFQTRVSLSFRLLQRLPTTAQCGSFCSHFSISLSLPLSLRRMYNVSCVVFHSVGFPFLRRETEAGQRTNQR